MPSKPTIEQQLASLLASSGCSSLSDPKFARYLDQGDPLGYMRYNYTFPTLESMARQPEPDPQPTPVPDIMAQHQEMRNARAGIKSRSRSNSTASASSESSSSSIDDRPPQDVYQEFKRSAHGQDSAHRQSADISTTTNSNGTDKPSATVPSHLLPEQHEQIIYLAGNSLGLQSKLSASRVQEELTIWQDKAVSGWFSHTYKRPWKVYAEKLSPMIAGLVGAKELEVATMGNLTANLHLLLCSFYRPTKQRYKILFEAKAFPSDHYAFASQVEMHGYKEDGLITAKPRKGEYTLRTEDILEIIEKQGEESGSNCVLRSMLSFETQTDGSFPSASPCTQQSRSSSSAESTTFQARCSRWRRSPQRHIKRQAAS